ncbi:subtype B tannase [Veillonella sp. R32]|uniref:subtype B tannase n=1 Tax=Veillonella sp. R32 TaxID=2021312 RepID=UPI00138A3A49|nr:subtype B tannase [Veillonella sp. R32]
MGAHTSSQSQSLHSATYTGGTVISKEGQISITATSDDDTKGTIQAVSEAIRANSVLLQASKDVSLESATNTQYIEERSSNSGASLGVNLGTTGILGIEASVSRGRGNTVSQVVTHAPMTVEANEDVSVEAGRDISLVGAMLQGDRAMVKAGQNLTIQSVQDKKDYTSKTKETGLSVSIQPTGRIGSIGGAYNSGNIQSQYASVTSQAGIYAGAGGLTVDVGDTTHLTGAVLHSEATPTLDKEGNPNASLYALSRGLVVAAPATRGRTNTNETGEYIGKAPAVIVDLKAAVAYLHSNDKRMAGNANRIISNGTSAGGAVSLLLGATGNNIEYAPYLNELGAAKGRTDIYAVSAYCPITDLDHADMAYEWSYNGVNSYTGMPDLGGQMEPPDPALGLNVTDQSMPKGKTIALDADAMAYSQLLKKNFSAYVNSLELKDVKGQTLTLQPDGTGSFMTYAKSFIIDSANKANAEGTDINTADFLVYDTQHPETIVDINWLVYNTSVGRMKAPGAFDARNNSTGENNLFGTTTIDNQHFTEFAAIHGDGTSVAANEIIRLMNPLNYIHPYKMAPVDMTATSSDTSKYWRIRYGEIDNNTSMAVPLIVATRLANYGYEVNFAMPWGVAHAGDYDLPDLFDWIDEIV